MRPLVLRPHSMSRQKHTTHKFFTSLLQIHVFTLLHLYRKQPNETFPPASYTALSRIQHLVAVSSYQALRQISTPYPSNNGFNKQAFSEYSYTHPSPTQRAKAPTNTEQFRFEAKTSPKRQSFTHTPKSFSHSTNFHMLHPSFPLHLQTCSPVLSPIPCQDKSIQCINSSLHFYRFTFLRFYIFTESNQMKLFPQHLTLRCQESNIL